MTQINQHKSGQAAIIIVVITMMTVLGVAISTSTQSRVELKDAVYSTQSVQALECAEAGVERALVQDEIVNEESVSLGVVLASEDSGQDYTIAGCTYSADIKDYPNGGSGNLTIPSVKQNSVQEIRINYKPGEPTYSQYNSGDSIDIDFTRLDTVDDIGLAIYEYNEDEVARTMLSCYTGGGGVTFEDFTEATYVADGKCSRSYTFQLTDPVALRFRPLYSDMRIEINLFEGFAGYLIESDGTSGEVVREIDVYRFYSQMPGAFDEAVVSFSDSDSLQ